MKKWLIIILLMSYNGVTYGMPILYSLADSQSIYNNSHCANQSQNIDKQQSLNKTLCDQHCLALCLVILQTETKHGNINKAAAKYSPNALQFSSFFIDIHLPPPKHC